MKTLISTALFLIIGNAAVGQDSLGLVKIGETFRSLGKFSATAISGDALFAIVENGIAEISINRDIPQFVRQYSMKPPDLIAGSLDRLYFITDSAQFTIIQIARPENPDQFTGRLLVRKGEDVRLVDVQCEGLFLLVANSRGFQLFYIQDPDNPVYVSEYPDLRQVAKAALCGNFVYLWGARQYACCDISFPRLISLAFRAESDDEIGAIDATPDLLAVSFITQTGGKLNLYNNHNPRHPQFIGTWESEGETGQFTAVRFIGDLLYTVSKAKYLNTFSHEFPGRPHWRYRLGVFPEIEALFNFNDRFYLSFTEERGASGIATISLATPDRPAVVGFYSSLEDQPRIETFGEIGFLLGYSQSDGNRLPVAGWSNYQIKILDLTNPRHPSIAGNVTGVPLTNLTMNNDHLYLLTAGGVYIYDIQDLQNPARVGLIIRSIYSALVKEDILYGLSQMGGDLSTFDVSDPAHPVEIGSVRLGGNGGPYNLQELDSLLLTGDAYSLNIMSLANPREPRILVELDRNEGSGLFAAENSQLFTYSFGDRRIHIYDISSPTEPRELAVTNININPERLILKNNLLFVNGIGNFRSKILDVFDVTNPEDIRHVNRYSDDNSPIDDIAFAGDCLLSCLSGRVAIFDYSRLSGLNSAPFFDAIEPIESESGERITFEVHATDLNENRISLQAIINSMPEGAAFADEGEGRGVFDWHTGEDDNGTFTPGFIATDGEANDTLFVPIIVSEASEIGLQEIIPPPSSFSLFPPYPNPFNSSVTITFSEGIPHSIEEGLSLRIYDLSGRLVTDLLSGHPLLTPPASGGGKYSLAWDAGGLAAGVYLVRLEEEGKSVTRKVVLMR